MYLPRRLRSLVVRLLVVVASLIFIGGCGTPAEESSKQVADAGATSDSGTGPSCEVDNGGCSDICSDEGGDVVCSCPSGYELGADDATCADIDECATANGGCDQTCENEPGGYACSCERGYALGDDDASCDDVDECATDNGGCTQTCQNEAGGFVCDCDENYELDADGRTCNPIDPCETDNGGCDQVCEFVGPAEATCSCESGYQFDDDGTTCVVDVCAAVCLGMELCSDGGIALDNNCDGIVDEGCSCTPGTVQACFKGDPSFARTAGCYPGTQVCSEQGSWGPCEGGVHATDQCQNSGTGCTAISGLPFVPTDLHDGTQMFSDDAVTETFTVACPPGVSPCPAVQGNPRDDFIAQQSGEYTVTYTKTTATGTDSCVFPLFIGAKGLRVELEWEHRSGRPSVDLDLRVHQPGNQQPWAVQPGPQDCAYNNCTARDHSFSNPNVPNWFNGIMPPDPVSWYLDPVFENNTCYFAPGGAGADWQSQGMGCYNPRLDVDTVNCDANVTDPADSAFCAPENINIDFPPLDQWTRIAVNYFSRNGTNYDVQPRVNVYCDGRLSAQLGPNGYNVPESPMVFQPFEADNRTYWLVADVIFQDDGCGGRLCTVQPLYADPTSRTPVKISESTAGNTVGPAYPAIP